MTAVRRTAAGVLATLAVVGCTPPAADRAPVSPPTEASTPAAAPAVDDRTPVVHTISVLRPFGADQVTEGEVTASATTAASGPGEARAASGVLRLLRVVRSCAMLGCTDHPNDRPVTVPAGATLTIGCGGWEPCEDGVRFTTATDVVVGTTPVVQQCAALEGFFSGGDCVLAGETTVTAVTTGVTRAGTGTRLQIWPSGGDVRVAGEWVAGSFVDGAGAATVTAGDVEAAVTAVLDRAVDELLDRVGRPPDLVVWGTRMLPVSTDVSEGAAVDAVTASYDGRVHVDGLPESELQAVLLRDFETELLFERVPGVVGEYAVDPGTLTWETRWVSDGVSHDTEFIATATLVPVG